MIVTSISRKEQRIRSAVIHLPRKPLSVLFREQFLARSPRGVLVFSGGNPAMVLPVPGSDKNYTQPYGTSSPNDRAVYTPSFERRTNALAGERLLPFYCHGHVAMKVTVRKRVLPRNGRGVGVPVCSMGVGNVFEVV